METNPRLRYGVATAVATSPSGFTASQFGGIIGHAQTHSPPLKTALAQAMLGGLVVVVAIICFVMYSGGKIGVARPIKS
jgi:hypothetical protein